MDSQACFTTLKGHLSIYFPPVWRMHFSRPFGPLFTEGGDWENVKNVPFLHSEASHSLPPQLIDIIFALNESLQYKLHEDALISFYVNVYVN